MFGTARRSRPQGHARTRLLQSRNINSYERNYADAGTQTMPSPKTVIAASKYNPDFDAQFNINFNLLYFTVAAGVYTSKTAAQILAAQAQLATKLPFFLFGQSDFLAGFAKAQGQFPLQGGWTYEAPFIFGTNGYNGSSTSAGVLDATARAALLPGDLVQPFSAVLGGVTYVAFAQISCTDVGYGTLLAATSSDRFLINLVRITQNDTSTTGLNQFAQKISWFKQSLFGAFASDTAGPNAFKMPENLQSGIIDVPLVKAINKESLMGTYLLYTTTQLSWAIFVKTIKKAGDPGAV